MKREHFLVFLSPLTLLVLLLFALRPGSTRLREQVPGEHLYAEVMQAVQQHYVVPTDGEALAYAAVQGIMSELDPHSRVMPPEEFAAQQQQSQGEYAGIGVSIGFLDGVATLLEVIESGPAAEAGLLAGDRLVAINGERLKDLPQTLDAVSQRLRGPRDSEVVLSFDRGEGGPLREARLKRALVPSPTALSAWLDRDREIAWIALTAFRTNTPAQLERAFERLEAQPRGGIVLDLRDNRGGSLDAALAIADLFLDEGLVLTTVGRPTVTQYRSHTDASDLDIPLVVLIDEGSASASEVLAGALQDRGRAVLVGSRSYGKGVVQEIAPLKSRTGAGIKLTTRHYYTPAGRSIERRVALAQGSERLGGLAPDVIVRPGRAERERVLVQRLWRRYPESIRARLSTAGQGPEPDRALEQALALLTGASAADRKLAPQ